MIAVFKEFPEPVHENLWVNFLGKGREKCQFEILMETNLSRGHLLSLRCCQEIVHRLFCGPDCYPDRIFSSN